MSLECSTTRDLLFELRHGRVEAPMRKEFAGHLEECEACREYVDKVDRMLDEALIWEPARDRRIDRERIFQGVEAAVAPSAVVALEDRSSREGKQGEERDPSYKEEPEIFREREKMPRGRARRVWPLVAAVVLVVAWAVEGSLIDDSSTQEGNEVVANAEDGGEKGDAGALESQDEPQYLSGERLGVANHVKLFPTEGARWRVDSTQEGLELLVVSGEVTVEFLPRADEALRFSYPGGRGQVVGTVFYIDGDRSEVGVITGAVQMETPEGEYVDVEADQAWREGGHVAIEAPRREAIAALVDLEEHQAQIAALERARETKRAQNEPSGASEEGRAVSQPMAVNSGTERRSRTETGERAVQVEDAGPARLQLNAERAVRRRDFEQAAMHYEALLGVLPAADRAARSVRLDLARLYQRHLNQPERTLEHLRFFVETWPEDSVTPQAMAEICRLSVESEEEIHCRRR